jgi:hypothetical protein
MVETITEQLNRLDVLSDWQNTGKRRWSKKHVTFEVEETADTDDVKFRLKASLDREPFEREPDYAQGPIYKEELEDSVISFIGELEETVLN